MTISPIGLFIWGAAGVPLLGTAIAIGSLLTLGLWAVGGIGAAVVLKARTR